MNCADGEGSHPVPMAERQTYRKQARDLLAADLADLAARRRRSGVRSKNASALARGPRPGARATAKERRANARGSDFDPNGYAVDGLREIGVGRRRGVGLTQQYLGRGSLLTSMAKESSTVHRGVGSAEAEHNAIPLGDCAERCVLVRRESITIANSNCI
jgi:hypothetical protein